MATISAAFVLATILINRSFQESSEFPVITTVVNIPAKQVPFPAVTFNSGKIINPWGFYENLFKFVDYECFDTPYSCPTKKEAPLTDLKFFTEEIFLYFFKTVARRFSGKLIDLYEFEYLKHRTDEFPEFDRAVSMISLATMKDKNVVNKVVPRLARATTDSFAKFTLDWSNRMYGWGSKFLYPVIKEVTQPYNITGGEVAACMKNSSSCSQYHDKAYVATLLPLLIYRFSYGGLNLGDYVSYFASRVLTERATFLSPFISHENPKASERHLAKYLSEISDRLYPGREVNLTSYEMSKLLDESFSKKIAGFPSVKAHGCEGSEKLSEAWNSYNEEKNYTMPPCTDDSLDSLNGHSECCSATKSWKHQHDIILNFMKHGIHPPHFVPEREQEHLRDL